MIFRKINFLSKDDQRDPEPDPKEMIAYLPPKPGGYIKFYLWAVSNKVQAARHRTTGSEEERQRTGK